MIGMRRDGEEREEEEEEEEKEEEGEKKEKEEEKEEEEERKKRRNTSSQAQACTQRTHLTANGPLSGVINVCRQAKISWLVFFRKK